MVVEHSKYNSEGLESQKELLVGPLQISEISALSRMSYSSMVSARSLTSFLSPPEELSSLDTNSLLLKLSPSCLEGLLPAEENFEGVAFFSGFPFPGFSGFFFFLGFSLYMWENKQDSTAVELTRPLCSNEVIVEQCGCDASAREATFGAFASPFIGKRPLPPRAVRFASLTVVLHGFLIFPLGIFSFAIPFLQSHIVSPVHHLYKLHTPQKINLSSNTKARTNYTPNKYRGH